MHEDLGGNGSDGGYEADDEWAGGQTVGQWRKSKKRRKGPSLRTRMETSTGIEDPPGDEQYEADDEWPPRPKISQIRKFMKRKIRKPPKGPRESSDTGRLLLHLYNFTADSLKTTFNATSSIPRITSANVGSTSLVT